MNDDHVKKQFQAWSEGRLDKTGCLRIQQHLEDCQECRAYFDKMAILLEKPDAALLPRIEPDPFLPTRIRALAEESPRVPLRRKRRWLQWSFNGAMVVVAAVIGIYVGKGVATGNGVSADDEIISAYYEAFSQTGFADSWESVVESDEDTNGGNGEQEM